MGIVIHEFEVEASSPTQPATIMESAQPSPKPCSAQEVDRLLRRKMERAMRVWAH